MEEVALPTTRCVAQRDGDGEGGGERRAGEEEEEERGTLLALRTEYLHVGCQVPTATLNLGPPQITLSHAIAPRP